MCTCVSVCVGGGGVPTADFYSSVTVMCVTVPIDSWGGSRALLNVRTLTVHHTRFPARRICVVFAVGPVMCLESKHNDVCPEGDGPRVEATDRQTARLERASLRYPENRGRG